MSKFASEPWLIERSHGGWVSQITNAKGVAICYGSINDHDANLIAAAPDLLAAARKALGVLSGEEMSKQAHFDAMRLCVDAINKATEGHK
jgi:hypothetical protein